MNELDAQHTQEHNLADNLGHPIAYGRTAEIYAWHDGKVLKLYNAGYDPEEAKYELNIARAVQTSGLPIPHAGELVQAKGRNGLTYQRVKGTSMGQAMLRKPWTALRYARRMADLHARMHGITVQADIPRLHQRLANKINRAGALPDTLKSKVSGLLQTMPEGDRLCHGDFHPENILVTENGEVIIDWIDAALGNPLADVARTTVLTLGEAEAGQMHSPFMKSFIRLLHRIYIQRYFSLRPGGETEYYRWLPIVAAARLSENILELEKWLIVQAEKVDQI